MWTYRPESPAPDSVARITDYAACVEDITFNFAPEDQQGEVMADALNVHEATGLTPSQLQARVAELEAAMERALQIGHTLNFEHANDPTVDHNGRTADAVLDAYNGLRAIATSVGVWTK